jgi:hypothetical protein
MAWYGEPRKHAEAAKKAWRTKRAKKAAAKKAKKTN